MPANRSLAFEALMDTTNFVKGASILSQELKKIEAELRVAAGKDAAAGFKAATQGFLDQQQALKGLQNQYAQLIELRDRFDQQGKTRLKAGDQRLPLARDAIANQRSSTGAVSRGDVKTFDARTVDTAIEDLGKSIEASAEAMEAFGKRSIEAIEPLPDRVDQLTQALIELNSQQQLTAQALSGGINDDFVTRTAKTIDDEILALENQQRQIDKAVREQRNLKTRDKRSGIGKVEEQADNQAKRALNATREIETLTEKATLASQRKVNVDKELARIAELRLIRQRALTQEENLRATVAKEQDVTASDRRLAGMGDTFDELGNKIENLKATQDKLFDADAIRKIHPELGKQLDLLKKLDTASKSSLLTEQQRQRNTTKAAALRDTIRQRATLASDEALGNNKRLPDNVLQNELKKNIPGINRLFTNISQDLGRRFTATLQFAVSGALIFGVQKFVREFIQSAIEVERAFKDIESALEFDIDAPRGSVQFRVEVEQVRQQVLLLANEFNVLPTEANKAAFVMIARFKDVNNAMQALRAQLLATKVSTIDQSEVLRALTAVSEGFAAATLELNDSMSLNERLLKREAVAAQVYGKALDLAVQIQQKFGIEVEDTLEGGARATEVFRQMGFTMEETFAIVASTSRELGQTGQQAAERLVRSLGQLTDPKIRDALLNLSGNTEAFTLQISDFESGATAWRKIVDEFERLEKVNPQAARELLQIVGQRRELEAVAAALGTADLQKAIVGGADFAAGAAETRFKFLAVTVDETIKSILASIEELSQNFERLGGLNAIKVLLFTFEQFLLILNDAAKFVIAIRDAIDSVTGGFASWLIGVTSFSLALSGALRIALEIRRVFLAQVGAQGLGMFANFLGKGGGVGGFATTARVARLDAAKAGAGRLGQAGAFARGAGTGTLNAASTGLLALSTSTVGVAVAAVTAAVAMRQFTEQTKRLAEDAVRNAHNLAVARSQTKRDALDEGLELGSDAFKEAVFKGEIDELRRELSQSGSARPSNLAFTGGLLAQGSNIIFGTKFNLEDSESDPHRRRGDPESIPGSTEFINAQINKATRGFLDTQIAQLKEDVENAVLEPGEDGVDETLRRRLTAAVSADLRGGNVDPIKKARSVLLGRLNEAQELANDVDGTSAAAKKFEVTGGSEEDQAARLSKVAEINEEAITDFDEVLRLFGILPSDLTRSVEQLIKQLGEVDRDIGLGRISQARGSFIAEESAVKLKGLSQDFTDQGLTDEAEEARSASEDALLQGQNSRSKELDNYLREGTRHLGPREKLAFEIKALARFIEDETARSGANAAVVVARRAEMADKIKEQTEEYFDQAVSEAAHNVAMARNDDERRRAIQAEIDAIDIRIKQMRRDSKAREALQDDRDKKVQDLLEETRDEELRKQVGRFVKTRPPLDPLVDLNSRVIELLNALQRQSNSLADRIEAANELQIVYAQIAQVELGRLTALALSKVSVRDSLNSELVQLSGLKRASELAAAQYGVNTQAHLDAKRAILESQARIIDLVLELESTNRQLKSGFDVTNPLQAAEEEFIVIARQLQIPDLGDAERAALELQLKNSEAARLSASFNEGLFNLKFQFENGSLGQNAYIDALRGMLAAVDTSTHQGKELWLQINSLIEGLTDDISGAAFNIPGSIRIPTLFEVRRAVQAESLGVNYQDNRDQTIHVHVSDDVALDAVFEAISGAFDVEDARNAPGGAGITLGAP